MSPPILALALAALPQGDGAVAEDVLPTHPGAIELPPLREFTPPVPREFALEPDGRLLVLREDELPLVDGLLTLRAGSVHEPDDTVGLVTVLCEAIREGGSVSTPGPELDAWLDQHAATIHVSGGLERIDVRFSCLAEDAEDVLRLAMELLREPALGEHGVANARSRLASAVRRRFDDPGGLADDGALRVAYGPSSPWARVPTEATAAAIDAEGLRAFHAAHFGPDRLLVGVAGDARAEDVAEQLNALLEGWRPVGPAPVVGPPVFIHQAETTIHLIDRPGLAQTELRIAGPGTRRDDEAAPALRLWSYVVGAGGMTNRLMLRVRTEQGLAYSVGAWFQPDWNRAGLFRAMSGTRNDAVGRALGSIAETLRESLGRDSLSDEELGVARDRVLNAEVFRVDTPGEVLFRAMDLAFHGYPADHWEQAARTVAGLEAADVVAAAREHLDAERLAVVAVGPAELVREQLEEIAPVRVLSLEPGAATGTPEGAALAGRVLEALGGAKRWAALRTVRISGEVAARDPGGEPDRFSQLRDLDAGRLRYETRNVGSLTVITLDGTDGLYRSGLAVMELPLTQAEQMAYVHRRWLYTVLHGLASGSLGAEADGDARLVVRDDLGELCWLELGEDGRPTALGYASPGERGQEMYRYSDWSESPDGYVFAGSFTGEGRGKQTRVLEFEANPEPGPADFDTKP
jgi:zinc protease